VFRVTRLAGPADREAEELAAKYIEEQVALHDQRDVGPPRAAGVRQGERLKPNQLHRSGTALAGQRRTGRPASLAI